MWSVIATSDGGAPVLVEAARGVGEDQRLAAERAEGLDRDCHRARIAALVIMAAALEQRDTSALDVADDEPPGVALDGRYRKAGDSVIGDGGRVSASSASDPRPVPSTIASEGSEARPRALSAAMAASVLAVIVSR